jgi:uncharacterized protein (DUF302 family)
MIVSEARAAMLQVHSELKLDAIEAALQQAAGRRDARILSVSPVGHLLPPGSQAGAITFTICQPELYAALLEAEIRMSVFLPCRIAAYLRQGRVALECVSPVEFCRELNRPDLAPLAAPLEDLLASVMNDAAAGAPAHRGGLGATEEQMSVRGAIPQRIDCRGTKVEELAGTGEHDAQGG